MFKFEKVETLRAKVELKIPKDFGKSEKAEFTIVFKKLSVSERETLYKDLTDPEKPDVTEISAVVDNTVDVEGVADPDGDLIPFSADLLDMLLDESYIRKAIFDCFNNVQFNDGARTKN